MYSKKLYFWEALLMIYIIPSIILFILEFCVDSPGFTSILHKLAVRGNYASLAFNLIAFGAIILAFTHYYKLPLFSEGWTDAAKHPKGQLGLLCLVGVLNILFVESFMVLTGGRQELKTSLPYILSAVVTAPIVEEILYRHVLLRLFLRTYRTPRLAILYSAILFMMLHGVVIIHPILVVPYLTSGCILGYLYYKSRSLCFCILMHSFQNIVSYISFAIFF